MLESNFVPMLDANCSNSYDISMGHVSVLYTGYEFRSYMGYRGCEGSLGSKKQNERREVGKKEVGRNASLFNIKIEISIYLILKREGFFFNPFLFTFQTSLAPLRVYRMRLLGLMSHAQQLVSSDDT